MSLTLSSIHVYPVKSLGGYSVEEATLTDRGLEHDRRWMLVGTDGHFITQREVAAMACLHCAPLENGFMVKDIRDDGTIQIPWSIVTGEERSILIWEDTVPTISAEKEISKWFGDRLGLETNLVFMPEQSQRVVDPVYAQGIVSFGDGFPYLIISQASLDDLNTRLPQPIPMERFRPNLVIRGGDSFQEDGWNEIMIGDVPFSLVKPCSRCVITTTDQRTGVRGVEPLRTLATYRRRNGVPSKVDFGMNAVSPSTGRIKVNSTIRIVRQS